MNKQPPAIIDDTAEPTWRFVIRDYRKIASEGVWLDVINLMISRHEMGLKKHGTYLTPHNGRDSLTDALQEQLDCVVYLKNAELEELDPHKKKVITDSYHFALRTLENIYIAITL